MKYRTKSQHGFTIVEIMTVIVIIGIIAGYAWVKYPIFLRTSKATTSAKTLDSFNTLIQQYKEKYNRAPITETAGIAPGSPQTTSLATGITQDDVTFSDILHGAGLLDDVPMFKFGDNPISTAVFGGVVWDPNTRTFTTGSGTLVQWSTQRYNRLESVTCTTGLTPISAAGTWTGAFLLDGVNPFPIQKTIWVVILENIGYEDARALVEKLNSDGTAKMDPMGSAQQRGRVVFAAPAAGADTTTAYLYITD